MKHSLSLLRPLRALAVLAIVAGGTALAGCTIDPPGPSPILSRLPPDQAEAVSHGQPLTPEDRARYDAIDRQVLFEQDQTMAADAAARAWSRQYSAPPPVMFTGGFSTGGWGRGWGTGIGVGFGPYWGW
ncbi:hypothetical protein BTH42_16680 [Burkholderia sp. SRS-W-2-2016]|uniref:hypothetical protein n=1 Tax=Burkholderia sp. SRS-W-2-2016 TaxID=1926878 RepID=UPI00094B26CD|nr:hypothetical protein [Burkholderia sp. SRS-W-2-2016]OLL30579.1 hypothetical protein BTH42_16680 [Burkholderia sp. SRS-W-2-2016]